MSAAGRRADAERNRDAIVAAGLRVLTDSPDAGLAEIARVAGVTRTTVYAHFASREDLLEELIRRAVARAASTIDDGVPGDGPARDALVRTVAASWRAIAANASGLAQASRTLGEARTAELHTPVREAVSALVRRGQRDGSFRSDVPEAWLVATYFALVHAAGQLIAHDSDAEQGLEAALIATMLGAFTPASASQDHQGAAV